MQLLPGLDAGVDKVPIGTFSRHVPAANETNRAADFRLSIACYRFELESEFATSQILRARASSNTPENCRLQYSAECHRKISKASSSACDTLPSQSSFRGHTPRGRPKHAISLGGRVARTGAETSGTTRESGPQTMSHSVARLPIGLLASMVMSSISQAL